MHLIGVVKREIYKILNQRTNRPPVNFNSSVSNVFPPFPPTYHLMTRIFRKGRLTDIEAEILTLKKAGIDQIWISPVHSQSAYYMLKGMRRNDHGYWPSRHDDIDPTLGTENDLQHLIKKCQENNMRILMDLPVNHFGYGSSFRIGRKRVSVKNLDFFRKIQEANQRDQLLHVMLDNVDREQEVFKLLNQLSERCLYELPTFRHTNPEVQDYLLSSYKKFIDLGVCAFRIDAAKHIPVSFIVHLIRELTQYGLQSGKEISFLLEYWMADRPLNIVMSHLLNETRTRNIVFQDHQLMTDLRIVFLYKEQRNWKAVKRTMEERMAMKELTSLLVSIPESHDHIHSVKGKFDKAALYIISEFSVGAPIVFHHGKESMPEAKETNRRKISSFDFTSDFYLSFQKARKVIQGTTTPEVVKLSHEPCLYLKRGNLRLAVNLEGSVVIPDAPDDIVLSLGEVSKINGSLRIEGEGLVIFISN